MGSSGNDGAPHLDGDSQADPTFPLNHSSDQVVTNAADFLCSGLSRSTFVFDLFFAFFSLGLFSVPITVVASEAPFGDGGRSPAIDSCSVKSGAPRFKWYRHWTPVRVPGSHDEDALSRFRGCRVPPLD